MATDLERMRVSASTGGFAGPVPQSGFSRVKAALKLVFTASITNDCDPGIANLGTISGLGG